MAAEATMAAQKQRAASVSLLFNFASVVVKLIAALLTGSVGLLSEAIHSASDVFSSAIAYFGVRAAAAPPDEEHPYGHGKIESLAGFAEAILLFLIVIYIVIQAVGKLVEGAEVERLDLGMAVMAASSIGAFFTSRYVRRVGERTSSLALISNSRHLMVDFVTSVALLAALFVVSLTGWHLLDPISGLILAVWIGWGAADLVRRAFHELIDVRLPEEEQQIIRKILESESRIINFHRLRSRRSGSVREIDLHIVVPNEWSVREAHDVADEMERRIGERLAPAHVTIHVDPYDPEKLPHPK
jgi:cation diffusion facilitator family transporter